MLFTIKNSIKVFAILIPIIVIKNFEIPYRFFLKDIDTSFELGVFIAISNGIALIAVSVISVLICIKIWNKLDKKMINSN